jgi:superfamily II DNA or RNA helicase
MKLQSIHGEIGAMLTIADAPTSFSTEVAQLFSFANPLYQAASRFSPWGRISSRIPPEINLAWFEGDAIVAPRGLSPTELSSRAQLFWRQIKWEDKRTEAPITFPGLKIALHAQQTTLVRHFKELIQNEEACRFGNILYIAPTSAGKTLALASMAKVTGQRTLVLCLNELIKRSWHGDLYKAFGLAERDIGLIQQGTWRIGDEFTLASVMTLIRRKHKWPDLFRRIGCLIVDECDTCTANSVHQFIMSCPAKYLIGATATDSRERGGKIYMPSLFGAPRKRLLAQQKDTASSMALREVEVVKTKFQYSHTYGTAIDWHDLTDALMDNVERNKLIVKKAKEQWLKGESVLLTSRRVDHVKILQEMLLEEGVHDARILTGETNVDRIYSEKLIEGVLNGNCRMLVATMQAIKRGANLNPLSVLILAMPVNKRDLEQLIGRIRRRARDKHTVRLIYILDELVQYLGRLYYTKAISVFRKLCVPAFVRHKVGLQNI